MAEEQKQNEQENKLPQRDSKGHFAKRTNKNPSNLKKKCETEDDGTVKIRIVKDKKPLPPKDFEGRLEDIKERAAIGFIRSVAARRPNKIAIDGIVYLKSEYANQKVKDVADERDMIYKRLTKNCDLLKQSADVMEEQNDFIEREIQTNNRLRRSLWIWRGIAIGAIVCFVSYFGCKAIDKYNASKATQNTVQAAPTTAQ